MALVYGASDTGFFFSLISGTYRASVAFANASPVLPQNVLASFGGRLSYDDQNKLLTATGYLDPATQAAIKAALAVSTTDNTDKFGPGAGLTLTPLSMRNIVPGAVLMIDSGANAELIVVSATTATSFTADLALAHDGTVTPFAIVNDPSLPAAIDALGLANQQAVGPFFAQYPELLPLYDGFVAANEPLAQRYTDLLANFLPILKRERKQQQALQRHFGRDRPGCQLRDRAVAGRQRHPRLGRPDLAGGGRSDRRRSGRSVGAHSPRRQSGRGEPAGQRHLERNSIRPDRAAVRRSHGRRHGDDADRRRRNALCRHRHGRRFPHARRQPSPRRSTPSTAIDPKSGSPIGSVIAAAPPGRRLC